MEVTTRTPESVSIPDRFAVPLCGNEEADELRTTYLSLADEMVRLSDTPLLELIHPRQHPQAAYALYDGMGGAIPFLAELVRLGHRQYENPLQSVASAVLDSMTEQQWHAGMLSGALGFSFNIRFLQDAGFQFDSDPFEPLDEYLSHWLEHDPAIRSDMAHGIVGLGIFGILRSQTSVGRHYVDMVVHWLSERVHQTDRGLFWPGLIITEPEDARTNYWHWLGVAHGVGGIVGFLAQARSLNIRVNDCELLLEGAVRYVLETKRMEKATRPPESPGWCWGDLGLGMTLVLAGQACARADWQDEGVRFARESIAQTERISTLCLCHGTSGAAHLFGRFYQISNDDEFRSAAKRMLRATLESAQKNGPARFLFEVLMSGNELSEPYPSRGFLVGSSGIGACLLSATTPGRSLWETMLLMAPATLER